ncbi:dual OB domain-containing protein [Aquaspirillum serpens]|uniref:dual OB domain-containing protein n=1 Tax=Aquaspirillum serpens TaxID=190 RepID=UPI0003B69074|nr:hypothetical protein [Aquaspirillum serpens]
MTVVKRILCLANSKKMSGRCIAGREVLATGPGPWIRPVSGRPTEEVSEDERQYQDGSDPRVLDIIDVPLIRHQPHACQTENWLLDPGDDWTKVRQVGWVELQRYVENPATLWTNTRSTYNGANDEILQADADALPNSLFLIHVPSLELRVFAPGEAFGNSNRRVQAHFQYRGIEYALWVTDPVIEHEYKTRSDGTYMIGECCLCISLGEPLQKQNGESCRYKLVAAVIQRERVRP